MWSQPLEGECGAYVQPVIVPVVAHCSSPSLPYVMPVDTLLCCRSVWMAGAAPPVSRWNPVPDCPNHTVAWNAGDTPNPCWPLCVASQLLLQVLTLGFCSCLHLCGSVPVLLNKLLVAHGAGMCQHGRDTTPRHRIYSMRTCRASAAVVVWLYSDGVCGGGAHATIC